MFQRTLILAAISAAFAQAFPWSLFSPCQKITLELQRAFIPEDPHMFPNISNFNYIRDNISINLDFLNLTIAGFSNVNCNSFNVLQQDMITLNLQGQDLEFRNRDARIRTNIPDLADGPNTPLVSQLRAYSMELRFKYDIYTPDPINLCITNRSLKMTFHAHGIETNILFDPQVALELNYHPDTLVGNINHYLPRFANDLTTKLNKILCQTIPPTTAAIPNPTTSLPSFGGQLGLGPDGSQTWCGSAYPLLLHDRRLPSWDMSTTHK
ncbi:uncharacterized protein [Palaemon carinicauda]|uniref:uncharacterized protein n=1 Tax=Palaemon carinicauda TaxID=392227 RepID=UPI0035B65C62